MKKLTLIFLVACTVFSSYVTSKAQQKKAEIHFIDQDIDAAFKRAKSENKLIFVDCYTSWCSPCKWMADYVFTQDSVADFYNSNFVNLEMDMEKSIGPKYSKKYLVQVFPTYLFLDADGHLIHKASSKMEAFQFMDQGRRSLSDDRSTSVLKKKYENGDRSLFTMLNYIETMQRLNRRKADSLKTELVATITNEQLKSPLGWKAIDELATNMEGRFFQFMKKNEDYYRTTYGDKAVNEVIGRCLLRRAYGLSRDENEKDAFFETLNQLRNLSLNKFKVKAAQAELGYYINNNKVDAFNKQAKVFAASLLKDDDATLSFVARRAEYAGGEDFLPMAYQFAKQAVELNYESYSNQGTLAGICYKLGKKTEAVKAAQKAYDLSLENSSKIQKIAMKQLEKAKNM